MLRAACVKSDTAFDTYLSLQHSSSLVYKLINKSRAASNVECINEASKNPRRLWSTIKSLLHSSPPSEQLHLPYLNHWQIPLLSSSVIRLLPSKSPSLSNYAAVPHLLILISHTAMNYFQTSRLSPQLRYLNYFSQCQISRHNLTTSQLH